MADIVGNASQPGSAIRAPHTKSRAGCFTCKRRRVRCDQSRPSCSACRRLQVACEYPVVSVPRGALCSQHTHQHILLPLAKGYVVLPQQAQVTRHLQTPEDTARAIVYNSFSSLSPAGMAQRGFWSDVLTTESHNKSCYKYICLTVRDLTQDVSLRPYGFAPLSLHHDTNCSPQVLSAVRNYTRALAAFRADLPNMTPRDATYGTLCFFILEMKKSPFRDAIVAAGVSFLRPHLVEQARADGSVRWGIHPLYADAQTLYESEATITRFASAKMLNLSLQDILQHKLGGRDDHGIPLFNIPDRFPAPEPKDSITVVREKWEVFHRTMESWVLRVYWLLALGFLPEADLHLAHQRRFFAHFTVWHDRLSCRSVRLEGEKSSTNERKTLKVLCTYIRCCQLAMAAPAVHGCDIDNDLLNAPGGYYDSRSVLADMIIKDLDHQCVLEFVGSQSRISGGFVISGPNETVFNIAALPVVSLLAARELETHFLRGGDRSSFAPFTVSALSETSPEANTPHPLLVPTEIAEKQFDLLNFQFDLVKTFFVQDSDRPKHENEDATNTKGLETGNSIQDYVHRIENYADLQFLPLRARRQATIECIENLINLFSSYLLDGQY